MWERCYFRNFGCQQIKVSRKNRSPAGYLIGAKKNIPSSVPGICILTTGPAGFTTGPAVFKNWPGRFTKLARPIYETGPAVLRNWPGRFTKLARLILQNWPGRFTKLARLILKTGPADFTTGPADFTTGPADFTFSSIDTFSSTRSSLIVLNWLKPLKPIVLNKVWEDPRLKPL